MRGSFQTTQVAILTDCLLTTVGRVSVRVDPLESPQWVLPTTTNPSPCMCSRLYHFVCILTWDQFLLNDVFFKVDDHDHHDHHDDDNDFFDDDNDHLQKTS